MLKVIIAKDNDPTSSTLRSFVIKRLDVFNDFGRYVFPFLIWINYLSDVMFRNFNFLASINNCPRINSLVRGAEHA